METKNLHRTCPVCDGSKYSPYSPDGLGVCGNCRGTGTVKAKPKKFKCDLDPGSWLTFEEDHGFVLNCFNDSIHYDEDDALKVIEFMAQHIKGKIILIK